MGPDIGREEHHVLQTLISETNVSTSNVDKLDDETTITVR